MSAQREKRTIDYFRRGQVLFLVDGEWDEASAQELLNWATPIAVNKNVTITISRAIEFPSIEELLQPPDGDEGPQGPLSQSTDIEVTISSLETSERKKRYTSPVIDEVGRFALVSADVPELAIIPEPGSDGRATKLSQDASNLLDLIRTLDGARGNVFGGTRLQVVSPNWLASGGASSPGGTGGPGGRPVPYEGPANTEEYKIHADLDDVWLNGILDIPDNQRGKDVVVAILDTAPTKDVFPPDPGEKWAIQRAGVGPVLTTIYDQWVTQRQFNPPYDPPDPHSLVSSLLNPADPRLTVYLHPDVDRYDPNIEGDGYMQTRTHDYEMTDHGLFVAGLIHSLAPQAQIHLYQVLNRYGVGDLVTIADALLDVYLEFARERLVVNLSLNINIPLVKEHSQDDDEDEIGRSLLRFKEDEEKEEKEEKRKDWSKRQKLPADRICALAFAIGSRVIAAAGNNRKNLQSGRPQACYPAALDTVLGVGALPKKSNPPNRVEKLTTADYSNLSDRPDGTGITTLGGERGKKKGVLGIYLAEFPPREEEDGPDDEEHRNRKTPSKYGWGWWAGTSFATPIVSGITAALLGSLPAGTKTETAISQIFDGQGYVTEQDEDVLFVIQSA